MTYLLFKELNVLIVDNSKLMSHFVKCILISLGVDSKNIKIIDRYIKCELLAEVQYDLVFSDYHLDSGKTGLELIKFLRAKGNITEKTLFIITSSDTSKEVVANCIEAKVNDYIVKPFDFNFGRTRIIKSVKRRLSKRPFL